MDRNRFIIIALYCGLLVIGLCACASVLNVNDSPASEQPQNAINENSVRREEASASSQSGIGAARQAAEGHIRFSDERRFETRTIERLLTRKRFRIRADYPQLTGSEDRRVRRFNEAVHALVLRDVSPFMRDVPDREKERHPHWRDIEEYHVIHYNVMFASDDLISIVLDVGGYSWGAAHGYHYPIVFNYDFARGRTIRLAELFRPRSNYLQVISRLCREEFERQPTNGHVLGTDGWEEGARPTQRNYRNWAITEAGLVIIFEEYQIGPYTAREPRVTIPYPALGDVLYSHSPLRSLLH